MTRYSLIGILILLATLSYTNCKSQSFAGNFYRDIDYFKLEGEGRMAVHELDQFPYFRLIKIDSSTRVLEYLRPSSSEAYLYTRQDDHWVNVSERSGSLSHVHIYTYIFKNRILRLEYLATPPRDQPIDDENFDSYKKSLVGAKHYLRSISIRTLLKETSYYLNRDKDVDIEPSVNLERMIGQFDIFLTANTTYQIVGDRMVMSTERTPSSNPDQTKHCFTFVDEWGYRHNIFFFHAFWRNEVACD